ncbi:Gluconate 2-dehydrogenase subunit 3 [Lutibacter oricola]|uniref:Gluconate 2-dehydrogenase subunit 3 n=1 Tax=Lutibacter oricola TaxID=762486 RepID=A0A1H2YSU0_9FLAO|nr:gluconate 2-dehydrogenase subunit 3 family protein [Lutibacter oricola]SDX07629.1 Gluconate 2-dehydrogenase subunit 3 [Lutibacter oricola]
MNRRTAIGGILGIAGLGIASVSVLKYFKTDIDISKGKLVNYESLISELVDVIIPPTETPGAKSAKVQNFVINYMEECASIKEYTKFFNGLNDLQETCLDSYGIPFEECSDIQKNEQLENLDSGLDSNSMFMKISNKLRGRSFFNILKTLTIEGYCISSVGATQHLAYLPFPGKYEAITTLKTNQKAWATK